MYRLLWLVVVGSFFCKFFCKFSSYFIWYLFPSFSISSSNCSYFLFLSLLGNCKFEKTTLVFHLNVKIETFSVLCWHEQKSLICQYILQYIASYYKMNNAIHPPSIEISYLKHWKGIFSSADTSMGILTFYHQGVSQTIYKRWSHHLWWKICEKW